MRDGAEGAADHEPGRRLFAGECTFIKGVVALDGLPVTDLPDYLNWQLVMAWDRRAGTTLLRALVEICSTVTKGKRKPPAWHGRTPAAG